MLRKSRVIKVCPFFPPYLKSPLNIDGRRKEGIYRVKRKTGFSVKERERERKVPRSPLLVGKKCPNFIPKEGLKFLPRNCCVHTPTGPRIWSTHSAQSNDCWFWFLISKIQFDSRVGWLWKNPSMTLSHCQSQTPRRQTQKRREALSLLPPGSPVENWPVNEAGCGRSDKIKKKATGEMGKEGGGRGGSDLSTIRKGG